MNSINFFKFDMRRSKYVFLLSILLFAPISVVMASSSESIFSIFSYMGLVVMIGPTSLFTYEQKSDCGFDSMLPARDFDKVFGRYLLSFVYVIYELIVGIIVAVIISQVTNMKVIEMGLIAKIFIAVTLIYLSLALPIYYTIGRNLNQQIRALVVMIPCMLIWGVANAVIGVLSGIDISGVLIKIIENRDMVSLLAMCIAFALFILSALISTSIVKRKDYR